jgi:membrane protease YdiL (CAAX protease family)
MPEQAHSTDESATGAAAIIRRYQTTAFFAATLVLSWGWWVIAYVGLTSGGLALIHVGVGAFGPVVAGAVVTWASGSNLRAWAGQIIDWRVAPRWYLIAVLLPAVWGIASVPASLTLAGVSFEVALSADQVVRYGVSVVLIFFIGGGQEEPGWRGFALPRLQETYSALTASVIIGVVWAVWHLPLFFMGAPRNLSGNFVLFAVMVVGFSILLTWCYNSTGGSVLVAMVFHASINASATLLPVQSELATQWPLVFDLGLTGGVWLIAGAVVVWSGLESLSRSGLPDVTTAGLTAGD